MRKDYAYGLIVRATSSRPPHVQYLLIYDHHHRWGFPKGHVEKGETALEAAKRECFEETGIEVLNITNIPVFIECYTVGVGAGAYEKVNTYYLAEAKETKVRAGSDALKGGFFELSEALRLLDSEEKKRMLREVEGVRGSVKDIIKGH